MDLERVDGPSGPEIRVPTDGSCRTCSECGGGYVPNKSLSADGTGVRITFVSAEHGVQSVVDP